MKKCRKQFNKKMTAKIYESPDGGKTVYVREQGGLNVLRSTLIS